MLEINPAEGAKNRAFRYSGSIKILENIKGHYFKVRAGLQEFNVFSKHKISPGDILKGTIISRGNILYLSILKKQENVKKTPVFFISDTKEQFVEKSNILERFLTSFLDSTGKKADNLLLSILESLIAKKKITDNFNAVLAGEAYLKGLKNESAISAFLTAVSQDQGREQSSRKHGRKNNNKEEIKEILSEAISESDKENNTLFIFNHLPLPDRNWIIIPFKIDDIEGDLRLKITENLLKNVIIHVEKANFKWFFELSGLNKSDKMLKIYANREGCLVCRGKKFDLFKKKLHNLDVKIDDNIYDIYMFSGFSKINAPYDVDLRI